jgi:endo-1,4-beta-xylanase
MRLGRREFVRVGAAAGTLAALELSGCVRVNVAGRSAPPIGLTIRQAGASRGILAGCAVDVKDLRDNPAYAALIRQQAGIVVEENAFKFGPLRPSPTTFFFHDADYLVHFARKNGMKVRGHNFVWHESLPKWFAGYMTKENAERVLVEHIERVAGRYAGKIQSWDVANEVIDVKDGLPGGLRNSPWYKLLPNYIDIAYRTTRRVDPHALLVYNDYGIEADDESSAKKRAAVLGLLRGMQQRGVPIDALGIQSHIQANPKVVYGAGLRGLIAEVNRMGLKVLLTEMDVDDKALPASIPERDAAVAATYREYLDVALASTDVIALLTWGITDGHTWLNKQEARPDKAPVRPLPFDADLQPTPAYFAEVKALEDAPMRG